MNTIRIREPDALRPLHVVMLCLVGVTVAGGSLLLSAAESQTLVDGAIEWRVDSPLRAVVQLLCLNYQFPTTHAGAVKIYVLGIGAGLAILALGVAIAVRGRAGEGESPSDDVPALPSGSMETEPRPGKTHVGPLVAAQVLIGLYLLWSYVSSRWSAAPELAIGGSILLTIYFLWALAIGHGLSPPAARIALRMIIGVAAVTSLVAIWYYYGRNPVLRAKFPFGNPTFLGACLIPGILLTFTWACEQIGQLVRARSARSVAGIAVTATVLAVCLWALFLSGSRGAAVGLVFGLLAVVFFAVPRWIKLAPVLVGFGVAVIGVLYFSTAQDAGSHTGRDATLRLRQYAWSYAWRMYDEKPFTGHGQGGFVLAGDSYAADDVLADPLVFEARIAHAHSEWLEVMADLGSVGIVLLAAGLLFTVRAGMRGVKASPTSAHRWALLGLLGALVGLGVEEGFGVGLRVSGTPTLFYTVIGLIWAFANQGTSSLIAALTRAPGRRIITGVVGGLLGLATLAITQQDFTAAGDGYRAQSHLQQGDHEQAINLATRAISRLNPQRALTNLYRLSEAHVLTARSLQERADDREARAMAGDLPDPQLLALAQQDRQQSEKYCQEGSRALKELVSRSPTFLNHGWVLHWLNLTKAANAHARGEFDQRDQFAMDAAAALLRELARQPFSPAITEQYLGLRLSIATPSLELTEAMDLLARPLRHHRITATLVDLLARFASRPEFDERFEAIVREARTSLTGAPPSDNTGETSETWAPEKLRLAATFDFFRGDYKSAREYLDLAAAAYGSLAASAPIGAASCYAELADCQFFGEPGNPAAAIASVTQALSLTPESLPGRTLNSAIKQRMINYLLAAGDEAQATRLLRESGPPHVLRETLLAELGLRYRHLCESLLQRREALIFRKSPGELLPMLDRWMQRAIELNPDDYRAHFVAADLAFHSDDCEAAAARLKRALDCGLRWEEARQFIRVALQKRPDCQALAAIAKALPMPESTHPPEAEPAPEGARSPGR